MAVYLAEEQREYPADVHCVVAVEDAFGNQSDYLFLQFYDYVNGDKRPHPVVPACDYVFLHDSFALLSPAQLIRKVQLVPNVYSPSARNPRPVVRSPRSTGNIARPSFFAINKLF